ncbi:H+/Cl- antiporter ClcA [Dysgonomonas sp. PFB1-18]|uniref:hypothetical protein n=1 Tax=unclassified Dysgonomonas TaxID=2630389 RepID=UPI0024744F69|nr:MULTISPECIES: hypothetical protein [unclassified Dysgonomonas]MDH6311042.1 H+/Cl- antiporter ClcA [Dysgonomonas sp. PF1-14]MDH6337891.1 H+/Cl- antiporter ClcA [Dysgonomonas sp. PF1-16]MDH6382590.1 H+/Cl- antiporter ClcA [Dysgonomonas sp. PFB1-18]MDH6398023.1 H+/Cl- antiporter ClcA [Dysgonomonas sp. PF1-23]
MDTFLFVALKVCLYGFIVLFALVAVARLSGSFAEKPLESLKRRSERKAFKIIFVTVLAILGGFLSRFISVENALSVFGRDSDIIRNEVSSVHMLGGVFGGIIVAIIALSVIHLLYDYIHHDEETE